MTAYRRMMQKRNTEELAKPSVVARLLPFLLLAVVVMPLVITISIFAYNIIGRVAEPAPGILVADEPEQIAITGMQTMTNKGFSLTPIATYKVDARVISVDYPKDKLSIIAPVDLILGWGGMSDSAILNKITITQGQRSFGWRYYEKLPVDHAYVFKHLSLNTIIPATESVGQTLMKIRRNNIVSMSGYLVNIEAAGGMSWQSSTDNKDDDGNPAYYFLVTSIIIKK